jgi:hypothetical protein
MAGRRRRGVTLALAAVLWVAIDSAESASKKKSTRKFASEVRLPLTNKP